MTLPCGHTDESMVMVEYGYDHPESYDGVSEHKCGVCGERRGRWTGRLLADGDFERRYGRKA